MIKYTVYDKASGRIIRTGTALTEATARLQGNTPGTEVKLVGSDPKTETINPGTGAVENRLPMRTHNGLTAADKTTIVANGTDAMTIHFIPPGAKVEVFLPANMGLVQPPDQVVGAEANVIVTTTVKGIYTIRLSYLTFMDFEVTFNAN